jgi:hypothetical protein
MNNCIDVAYYVMNFYEFLCYGLVGSRSAHLIRKQIVFIFVCFGLIQYPTFNAKMRSCLTKMAISHRWLGHPNDVKLFNYW